MEITIFLFNNSVTSLNEVLDPAKTGSYTELNSVRNVFDIEARAWIDSDRQKIPKWANFFGEAFDLSTVSSNTAAFVMGLQVSGRCFAITAGYGGFMLNRKKLVYDFGIRAGINCIDPNALKSVDVRTIDITSRQSRVSLSKNSSVYDFKFNLESDHLLWVDGFCSDQGFAKSVHGSESLTLNAEMALHDIPEKCRRLLTAYNSNSYQKTSFKFIDYVRKVSDLSQIMDLEEQLKTAIFDDDSYITFADPSFAEGHNIARYKLHYRRDKREVESLNIVDIRELLGDIESAQPHEITVTSYDSNGDLIAGRTSLKRFIVFETKGASVTNILTLGNWFQVDESFAKVVDAELSKIPYLRLPFLLPAVSGESEGNYNNRVINGQNSLIGFDQREFTHLGDEIEVCDILTAENEFVCVKRWHRSATLSHLFAQGVVSANLLCEMPEYRAFIGEKCGRTWPTKWEANSFDRSIPVFVFAIMTTWKKNLHEALPFFSKINLMHAKRNIERLGLRVALRKIDYN